jgi:hypothetical protein
LPRSAGRALGARRVRHGRRPGPGPGAERRSRRSALLGLGPALVTQAQRALQTPPATHHVPPHPHHTSHITRSVLYFPEPRPSMSALCACVPTPHVEVWQLAMQNIRGLASPGGRIAGLCRTLCMHCYAAYTIQPGCKQEAAKPLQAAKPVGTARLSRTRCRLQ